MGVDWHLHLRLERLLRALRGFPAGLGRRRAVDWHLLRQQETPQEVGVDFPQELERRQEQRAGRPELQVAARAGGRWVPQGESTHDPVH